MKTKIFILPIALLFLASCGIINNNDFASRKYTHFRKGEVAIQQNQKTSKPVALSPINTTEAQIATTHATGMPQEVKTISVINTTSTPKTSSPQKATIKQKIQKAAAQNAVKTILKKQSVSQNSTASEVDQLILVILALLLPPLAVFLVAGLGTEFWIDLILSCFFWIPGVIYALLIVLGVI